jgi:hypothetical protein
VFSSVNSLAFNSLVEELFQDFWIEFGFKSLDLFYDFFLFV